MNRWLWFAVVLLAVLGRSVSAQPGAVPGTQTLTAQGDRAAEMLAGIDKFLTHELERAQHERENLWARDFSSAAAYEKSITPNREHLPKIIGVVDARLPVNELQFVSDTANPALVAETPSFTVHAVRWEVFRGVFGEGLWLRPRTAPKARVIAIPDADQTPEMLVGLAPGLPAERQFAKRLAEHGAEVLVPVLVDRQDTWSGSALLKQFTNQPHREWIYRQAYELGRHIIGYEVQKVLAAVDWFEHENAQSTNASAPGLPIGAAGYAEGGLVAFYAAALDTRIAATLVSGYFDSRQKIWAEPIYRNVFGLLREFGDAELATMIYPRALLVEHAPTPTIDGPPKPRPGRSGAAPGRIETPDYASVEAEFERARSLLKRGETEGLERLQLISAAEGMTTGPGSERALAEFLTALGVLTQKLRPAGPTVVDARARFDPAERQHQQVRELETFTQRLAALSGQTREAFFWNKIKATSPEEWRGAVAPFKATFQEWLVGQFPASSLPLNARSRDLCERPKWTGYEVVLDVAADVFAWGYLLVPKDIKPGERRPVVVCQHGLNGLPDDTLNEDQQSPAYKYYRAYAARLAAEGFVVFAPHNPYWGDFRPLQRKANPLQLTLFSIITAQHSRILDWLAGLPFVDAGRIGFYGLSYGGTTAMRVPPVLDRYAVCICSGNFNDWTQKNVSVDSGTSYMLRGEYEMPEFGLGITFSHAEMAALIVPRPFMVERGHDDSVGVDEWVAAEYAKVRRLYDRLGIPERTAIEYFNGGHEIHGVGTVEFLRRWLR